MDLFLVFRMIASGRFLFKMQKYINGTNPHNIQTLAFSESCGGLTVGDTKAKAHR